MNAPASDRATTAQLPATTILELRRFYWENVEPHRLGPEPRADDDVPTTDVDLRRLVEFAVSCYRIAPRTARGMAGLLLLQQIPDELGAAILRS